MTVRWRCGILVCLVWAGLCAGQEKIGYHEVKTGADGRIVPWYGSGPSQAYDHVVRLVFGFWKNMRSCPNGVPLVKQVLCVAKRRVVAGSGG